MRNSKQVVDMDVLGKVNLPNEMKKQCNARLQNEQEWCDIWLLASLLAESKALRQLRGGLIKTSPQTLMTVWVPWQCHRSKGTMTSWEGKTAPLFYVAIFRDYTCNSNPQLCLFLVHQKSSWSKWPNTFFVIKKNKKLKINKNKTSGVSQNIRGQFSLKRFSLKSSLSFLNSRMHPFCWPHNGRVNSKVLVYEVLKYNGTLTPLKIESRCAFNKAEQLLTIKRAPWLNFTFGKSRARFTVLITTLIVSPRYKMWFYATTSLLVLA